MENGVIVYLTCMKDMWVFPTSLSLLFASYNKYHNYPVVVFHDDLTSVAISSVLVRMHQELGYMPNVKFERIAFKLPDNISTDPAKYLAPLDCGYGGYGYRHMCRFFAGQVYNHPALLQYDWYMRLDSDSFLLSDTKFDMFQRMAENGYEYGYISECDKDNPATIKGFFETTKKYFSEKGIVPTCLDSKLVNGEWNMDVFYTNFVIGKMSFFRSQAYQDYFNYLDATGNFYYNRWGDHDVHWFAVNSFLPAEKVWCIKDVAYQHGSWVKNAAYIDGGIAARVPDPFKKWVDDGLLRVTS